MYRKSYSNEFIIIYFIYKTNAFGTKTVILIAENLITSHLKEVLVNIKTGFYRKIELIYDKKKTSVCSNHVRLVEYNTVKLCLYLYINIRWHCKLQVASVNVF